MSACLTYVWQATAACPCVKVPTGMLSIQVCPSPSWWVNPAMQLALKQLGVFMGQATLQPPQFLASFARSTSHPLLTLLSQSPQPMAQPSNSQTLFTHLVLALGMLQLPQVQPPFLHTWPCGQAA